MYRIRITGTGWDGGPSLNTLYFTSGSYSAEGALAVATHVRACWNENVSWLVPTGVTHAYPSEVDEVTPSSGEITTTFSIVAPATSAGRGAATYAPVVAAAVLRLTTAVFIAGRRLKGRMFISPLATDTIAASGAMHSGTFAYATGFYDDLTAALDAGDAWVVWHRPVSGAGGSAGQVTGCSMAPKVGELRSRRD